MNNMKELKLDELGKVTGGVFNESLWTEQERYEYHAVIKEYAEAVKAKDQERMGRAWKEMERVILPLREKYDF